MHIVPWARLLYNHDNLTPFNSAGTFMSDAFSCGSPGLASPDCRNLAFLSTTNHRRLDDTSCSCATSHPLPSPRVLSIRIISLP